MAFAVLGFFDGVHDARECAVGGDDGRFDVEGAGGVDAAGEDSVTRCGVDRDRFAGHRRYVEHRASGTHDTVGRHAGTGAQHDHVTNGELVGFDLDKVVTTPDDGGRRDE